MARPASIDDTTLIDALSAVFKRHGYEGTSFRLLEEASGLKRASLFHRFPGGKAEILQAALTRAEVRFSKMLAPATESGDPVDRATRLAMEINEYYDGGSESCLIVALTLGDAERRTMAAPCIDAWTGAFVAVASDAGLPAETVTDRAHELVAQIEGALVIAAATGNRTPFERAIANLPTRLTT